MEEINKKRATILILILATVVLIVVLINSIAHSKNSDIGINKELSVKNDMHLIQKNVIIPQEITKEDNKDLYEENDMHLIQEDIIIPQEIIKETNKDIVYIENMNEIRAIYKEEGKIAKVASKIEDTIMNIFNKSITDKNSLETFYNTNKEKIEQRTYVKDYIQFQNLLNKIFTNNSTKIIESKIKIESAYRKNDNTIMATIELSLDNSDVVLLILEINETTSEIKIS